ncbi:MAG: general secretion pathway protein [Candidatus Parabeggiatoa sp. nov. 3]|nr:MAG: general secretion pathway protein [Gammaproteobacteria bacterium]RKZ66851.1 MAG: general secretion pathway protein [Gammaproteobacteria bacterium]RKZ88184.1 MAG: general secretion pathway protein [Gammaproteobacteria bacterium]
MYYDYFGLKYPPFKITPDTQLFYSGGDRGLVLDALIYAVESGEGILKVVGEVGSGKTMLCRMLEQKLSKRIEVVYIANPRLPPEMILHAIALEMRLLITPEDNRLQVMHSLHQHLLEKQANHQQVVVFIEEAQEMPLETLEEIRLLSNLETSRSKLLQIVLFGQPELDIKLSTPNIRQLKERITHRFYLKPFTGDNIRDYLHFRMYAVGYRGPPVFSPAAVRLLTQVSKGLIRRINILADKALLAAFANEVHLVRPKYIRIAARDSGFAYPFFSYRIGMGVLLLIALSVGFLFSNYREAFWTALSNHLEAPLAPNPMMTSPPISAQMTLTVTTDSLLDQRLKATQDWLAQANGQHYTIQVMQTKVGNTADLEKLLRKPAIKPLLDKLYLYRISTKGELYWEMVYGEFVDNDSAAAAIAELPKILQRNKPFLRKINQLISINIGDGKANQIER